MARVLAKLSADREMRTAMRLLLSLVFVSFACACTLVAPARRLPAQGYRYLDLVIDDGFDDDSRSQGVWREYAGEGLFLGVDNGAFLIDFTGRQYVWTQHEALLADTVMEAEFRLHSADEGNAYGLACRLDQGDAGRGYFFLISGDGYASIRWSNGRSLEAIAPAQPASAIKRGAVNLLRAICIGDYLALWVNDAFVLEARDRRAEQGAVGFSGVMNRASQRLSLTVDELKVWRAAQDDRAP